MATLALCNHTIGSTGSYTWWVGYLTGGEVLYYQDWPRKNTELDTQVVKEDYFPSSWKGIL